MTEVLYAALSHIGASPRRTLLEDRSCAMEIQTAGGLTMTLGVVSDGVGGENAGERAAELAVETILEHCKQSTSQDIPKILRSALEKANDRVYREARHSARKMNMGATAAVAAIHKDKLYLANVGDSRIYLIRDGKTIPLTIDHTWMNEVVSLGKLSQQEAMKHPRRDEIVRAIGNEALLNVDLGIWLQGGKEKEKEAQSAQGLPLFPDDRVFVCSDGVIKSRHDQPEAHYVEEHEFPKLVHGLDPERAVDAILKQARSRQVDDNISAVILEVSSGSRPMRFPSKRIFLLAAIVPLLLVGMTWLALRWSRPSPGAAVLPEIPSLPSGFAFLSLLGGAAERQAPGGESMVLHAEDIIRAGYGVHIRTLGDKSFVRLDLADGSILYLGPDTEIELRAIADGLAIHETLIVLEQGYVLVVLDASPEHSFAVASSIDVTARMAGSVMGVHLETGFQRLHLDCFQGMCSIEGQRRYVLSSGQHIWMDKAGTAGPTGLARNGLYTFAGEGILGTIAVTQVIPTSGTLQPTKTLGPLFLTPTYLFVPTKTDKPRQTAIPPTQTVSPEPTDTEEPPTDTEEPPTFTPTNTHEPTDTPSHTPSPSPSSTPMPSETPSPAPTSTTMPSDTPEPTETNSG